MAAHHSGDLVQNILDAFTAFTGPDYVQEDDMTLVTISFDPISGTFHHQHAISFELPSQPGNERQAAAQVLAALEDLDLDETRRKRLETAVAEAAMNAMEHGNGYNPDLTVKISILEEDSTSKSKLPIRVTASPFPPPLIPIWMPS